jgi:hypothetical protein
MNEAVTEQIVLTIQEVQRINGDTMQKILDTLSLMQHGNEAALNLTVIIADKLADLLIEAGRVDDAMALANELAVASEILKGIPDTTEGL